MKVTFRQAITDAIAEEMRADDRVLYIATNPPPALTDEFGERRVRRSPIAESAMTGISIGAAGSGYRPVVDWGNVAFSFVAFDQTVNQAARIRYMFGGQQTFPIVYFGQFLHGTRSAAQHSQTAYALYGHVGGLKVVAPSDVATAKGLMKSAIRDDNPVVYLFPGRLNSTSGEAPDGDATISLGSAQVIRAGTDVTLVGIGYMAEVADAAAEALAQEGVNAEVIDPRTLVPLDVETILESVRKTGRLVVVDESFPTCSFASEIAAAVAADATCLRRLRGPVQRVCAKPVPIPFSPPLEDYVLPAVADVEAAVARLLGEHAEPVSRPEGQGAGVPR